MSSKKYKDLSKNTILFTISNFGSKLISFFLVPLYTYVLSTGDYGTADLMTTTAQLLIPFLSLNIQDAVLRFALNKDYSKSEIISVACRIIGISSVLLASVLLVLDASGILSLDGKYILFLYLSYMLGTLTNSLNAYLKATDHVRTMVIAGITNTFLTCILNIVLLLVVKIGIYGYLISNICGSLLAVLIMLFAGEAIKDAHLLKINKNLQKEMIAYSSPLIVNSIAWWINSASDRYILSYFAGTAANGIYSVSYKIPTILSTVQSIFYSAWSISAITEFDKNDTDGFMGNIYTLYSCASIMGCSCIMLLNISLSKFLYAKEFFVAWQYVPALLVGTVFNGIALFDGCIFTAVKKTKEVSYTTIIGATVNTGLNFALIPFLGALGAALATMIGYFVTWLIRTIQLRGIVKMKVNWGNNILSLSIIGIQGVLAWSHQNPIWQIPCVILIVLFQGKYLGRVVKTCINFARSRK